jgi:dipeptidyl aminopeptidase/acylaminoacyl peptidase
MDRPQMDRPRERRGTPASREALRLLKAGALIVAVVLVVGSLPVLFVWFAAEDPTEVEPIAYRDEELTLRSGDVELAARLRLPGHGGPHPALVIAHGSGRTTRDDYERLGADLATNGFALLTYDKRGVGDSGGEYFGVGPANAEEAFDLLAGDVLAGVDALAARSDIRADRIGVLGISQGGWIGPVAATRSDRVAFLVVLSGTTVPVGEEIYYSELTGERDGADLDDAALSAALASFDGDPGHDPHAVLDAIDVPTLWILGSDDRSIPVPETVATLEELVAAGRPFTFHVLQGYGHGLRDPRTGATAPAFPLIYEWLVTESTAR